MIQSNVVTVEIHPRDLIRDKCWTYEQAAYHFNVELSTIWRWMAGKMTPSKKYFRLAGELSTRL